MVQKQLWRFHVAVMVRQHGFLVIDPLQDKPLPYVEWVAITAYDIKGRSSRARFFYATDPRKFLPAFGAYDVKQLEDPVLKLLRRPGALAKVVGRGSVTAFGWGPC